MSRPATKKDLIEAANAQFEKLRNLIAGMSEDEHRVTMIGQSRI